ncbi:MAG TPA: hydrogenase maturation protease [Terriglobia bacterium]|nr:hydrogenase maturation protease [Terriglobia bacterium]
MKPTTVLIIGVGTAYRNDDAAGLIVAERLRARLPEGASVITHEGEGVSLMEQMAGCESVVVVDAMCSGAEPGVIRRFNAGTQSPPAQMFRHSTHAIGIAEAIELGRTLGKLPRCLIVYGIEGRDFDAGTQLSPAVESSIEIVTRRVLEEAQRLLAPKE